MAAGDNLAQIDALLKSYGLDDLSDWAKQEFQAGKTVDQVILDLRQQKSFQTMYSAIFDREAKGLPPVTVAEIQSYRNQALQNEHLYGLPTGFLSSMQNVNKLIAGDVSMQELTTRVQEAATLAQTVPAEQRQAFQDMYGVGQGELTAYFADPDHAQPMLEKQYNASAAAGGAIAAGYGPLTGTEAEKAAGYGLNFQQARNAFGKVEQAKQLFDPLNGADGTTGLSREDQIAAASGDPVAIAKMQKVADTRTAEFQAGGAFAGGKGLSGAGTAQ